MDDVLDYVDVEDAQPHLVAEQEPHYANQDEYHPQDLREPLNQHVWRTSCACCVRLSSQSIRFGPPGGCASSLPLFTGVRGRSILRTSGCSTLAICERKGEHAHLAHPLQEGRSIRLHPHHSSE